MSLPTEPPDWSDIFEHEDPGFYSLGLTQKAKNPDN
jgi:hypothetical protein